MRKIKADWLEKSLEYAKRRSLIGIQFNSSRISTLDTAPPVFGWLLVDLTLLWWRRPRSLSRFDSSVSGWVMSDTVWKTRRIPFHDHCCLGLFPWCLLPPAALQAEAEVAAPGDYVKRSCLISYYYQRADSRSLQMSDIFFSPGSKIRQPLLITGVSRCTFADLAERTQLFF